MIIELKNKVERYSFIKKQIDELEQELELLKQEILTHAEMPAHQLDIGNFIVTRSVCKKQLCIEYADEIGAITYKKIVDTKAIKELERLGHIINYELYDKLLIKEKEVEWGEQKQID